MVLDLRWLGLLSMGMIVAASALPLLGKPVDWQDSVSHSWINLRTPQLRLHTILMSLAGTGLCISLVLWLIPHYRLPSLMYALVAVALVAFMAVAWVPMADRPGEHSFRHAHFLGGSVLATLAILAMAAIIGYGSGVPIVARQFCFAAMLLAACWPLLFFGPARRAFLALESLIALAFSVAVVLLFVA